MSATVGEPSVTVPKDTLHSASTHESDSKQLQQPHNMECLYRTGYAEPNDESKASGIYVVGPQAKPTITRPDEILVRVYAASINPVDWKISKGDLKLIIQEPFPAKLGYDMCGVVEAIGEKVTKFKVGDEILSRVDHSHQGTFAEYALTFENLTCMKPNSLSFIEASCLPLAGVTALQCIEQTGITSKSAPRSIFIPAALGGVGSLAIQLAHYHFGIEKIVTTVSTSKMDQARQFCNSISPSIEIIDYKTEDPVAGREATFDAVFDTTGQASDYIPLLKPGGACISIATVPNGDQAAGFGGSVPWFIKQFLNLKDWWLRRKAANHKATYSYWLLKPNAEDLQILVNLAEKQNLKPIVGKTFPLTQSIEALHASMSSNVVGKVVIIANDEANRGGNASSSSSSVVASKDEKESKE